MSQIVAIPSAMHHFRNACVGRKHSRMFVIGRLCVMRIVMSAIPPQAIGHMCLTKALARKHNLAIRNQLSLNHTKKCLCATYLWQPWAVHFIASMYREQNRVQRAQLFIRMVQIATVLHGHLPQDSSTQCAHTRIVINNAHTQHWARHCSLQDASANDNATISSVSVRCLTFAPTGGVSHYMSKT